MAVSISATGLKGEAAMKIHGEVLFRVQGLGLCKGLLQKISILGVQVSDQLVTGDFCTPLQPRIPAEDVVEN